MVLGAADVDGVSAVLEVGVFLMTVMFIALDNSFAGRRY